MSSKILVPYDFSQEAKYSLKLGKDIAARLGYKLKVLHCLDFPGYPYLGSDSIKSVERTLIGEGTSAVIDDITKMFGSMEGLEVDIVSGSASSNILNATFDKEVSYTFMGYKNRQIPNHIGSTTRDILRFAKGSVMSLKKEVSLESIKHILVVTDFFNTAAKAIENLKLIQRITKAKLTFVYVNTRESWLTTKETKRSMKHFSEIHGLGEANLEIVNDDTIVSGVLNGLLTSSYDLIALKLNGLSDTKKINDLHLMGEVLLECTDIPILTYVHENNYR